MLTHRRDFLSGQNGQAVSEYGVIIAVVVLAGIVALGILSGAFNAVFTGTADQIPAT